MDAGLQPQPQQNEPATLEQQQQFYADSEEPSQDQQQREEEEVEGGEAGGDGGQQAVCAVCGEGNAKMHYGVLSCLGCKGFFRRALKKVNEYECLRDNNCTIDKQERNSCRSCRLQKCLDAGMDPAAVRPDRDFTGKQQMARRLSLSRRKSQQSSSAAAEERRRSNTADSDSGKSWSQRLPVEMKTMLMTLQNIEAKVVHGDTAKDAAEIYPLRINTIKEVIEDATKLRGRRTEMRYEPYRMAKNEELSVIVYRRLIAAIDWVELLSNHIGGLSTEDRIALVKSCFGPLTLFKCSARTAVVTDNEDMLCLCNFAYVPREISKAYSDAYHLDNGLVGRLLNELVSPFRRFRLADEEVVCLSAIIVLNPMAKDLSEDAADKIFQLRNRIYATFYQIIKESRPECNTNSTFGNLLLYLPIITSLANAMSENLRFAQTFSTLGGIPLLTSMFGCFPVEPFLESEMALMVEAEGQKSPLEPEEKEKATTTTTEVEEKAKEKPKRQRKYSNVGTQTMWIQLQGQTRKRRLGPMPSVEESNEFRLLKAPCSYTLTEMFDDRMNALEEEQQQSQMPAENPAKLSKATSCQQLVVTTTEPDQQQQQLQFRQPSTSWSQNRPTAASTSGVIQFREQQPEQTPTSSHQQRWPAAASTFVPPYPPTTQIQGLYLNEESGSHRIHEQQQQQQQFSQQQHQFTLPPQAQQQQQQAQCCWPATTSSYGPQMGIFLSPPPSHIYQQQQQQQIRPAFAPCYHPFEYAPQQQQQQQTQQFPTTFFPYSTPNSNASATMYTTHHHFSSQSSASLSTTTAAAQYCSQNPRSPATPIPPS